MGTIEENSIMDLKCKGWLQNITHAGNPPSGPVFLLLTKNEFESNINLTDSLSAYLVYGDDNFIIYSFDEINQYWNLIE